MKNLHLYVVLCTLFVGETAVAAMDHSRHRGGRGAGMGSASCLRPQISKMIPAHLATVAPGSDFSFVLSNIDDPEQIFVEIKKQPVKVTAEFKDPFYVVKGKIPASLHDTAARVDVKIESKIASCRAADGWLLKISEN